MLINAKHVVAIPVTFSGHEYQGVFTGILPEYIET
jgi:hypothetical protein